MSSEQWKELYFREIVKLLYGKSLSAKKRISGKYNVYGSGGIIGTHNDYLVEGPGIIIGRKGTVGSVYFEKNPYFPIDTTYYIKDSFNYNIKYLFYMLCNANLNIMNTHSAVPGLNRDNLYQKKFKVPKLEEQKQIATILSSLDDKIELNNRINKNLETMAQAIFKHWFIDFEFPNENGEPYKSSGGEMVDSELGPIPEGWNVRPLDQIADFLNGLAMQKYRPKNGNNHLPVLKIKELKMGKTSKNSDKCSVNIESKYIVDDGDIIFSWSGSLEVRIWCGGKAGLNQHLFKVTSANYSKWFYYYWIKYHIGDFRRIAEDKTTTMGHIKREHLRKAKVLDPGKIFFEKFNKLINGLFKLFINNEKETKYLSQLRGTLIPKLMSGEIRVPTNNIKEAE